MDPSIMFMVIFVLAATVASPLPAENSCRQDPEGGLSHHQFNIETTTYFHTDQQCQNGSLIWNNPAGSILVTFKLPPHQHFDMCIKDIKGSYSLKIVDETTEHHREVAKFVKDDRVMMDCVETGNGQIRLLLVAGPLLMDSVELGYHIIP